MYLTSVGKMISEIQVMEGKMERGEGGSGWVVEDEGWDYLSAF
jgi:hypothetical protein